MPTFREQMLRIGEMASLGTAAVALALAVSPAQAAGCNGHVNAMEWAARLGTTTTARSSRTTPSRLLRRTRRRYPRRRTLLPAMPTLRRSRPSNHARNSPSTRRQPHGSRSDAAYLARNRHASSPRRRQHHRYRRRQRRRPRRRQPPSTNCSLPQMRFVRPAFWRRCMPHAEHCRRRSAQLNRPARWPACCDAAAIRASGCRPSSSR